MSGRRRRPDAVWDNEEEKRSSAENHSNISPPGRFQNWSKSQVHDDLRSPSWDPNRNGPKDDYIRRDRDRMYSHSTLDGWEKPYSTHPSDDSYDMPYRSRDKGVGGNVRMSRERERTRSPNGSRSRSRDGGIRESTRGHRHETNASYPNMRNNSKDFATRGGGNESWSRRTDYKDSSRYNDYPPHRNVYDDHRNTRIPCRYFAAGNCNRDNCKFSHDVPEVAAGGYDGNRQLGNKNRTWRNEHDDLNARPNRGEMEKKPWNGSLWNDVKSGGSDETSRQGHTSDDHNNNNTTWDSRDDKKKWSDGHASRDASGFHDNKTSSWTGPTSWDGFSVSNSSHKYEEPANEHDDLNARPNRGEMEKKPWNGSLWNDVKSGGSDETSRRGHTSDGHNNNNTTWDSRDDKKKWSDGHASRDASGFHDNKTSSWTGPTSWDGFSVSNSSHKHEEPAKESLNDNYAQGRMSAKSGSNIDRHQTKKWDGPLWDECSEQKTDSSSKITKWDGPGFSKPAAEIMVNDADLNSVGPGDANQKIDTRSVPQLKGSEQSDILLSNPFNGQVQGMYVHMENQNKEGPKPLEVDAPPPPPQALNDISLTSQQAPLSQPYTELHLSNAIDYLKSLPNDKETRAKEEVKVGVPMDSVNELPSDSKVSGVMEKEAKKEGENRIHVKVAEEEGETEKAMRQFKISLVDFVKEILKPKWKEGKMSREMHKNVVKKVVEKVTSTIQGTQIPTTQPKIDQYLAYSKPKITKLVEAYMERLVKA